MEVVGAVASAITLAELAPKVGRQARKLQKRMRDAPLELKRLRENVDINEEIIERLVSLRGDDVEAPGLREALATIETLLRDSSEEIGPHVLPASEAGRWRARVRWAFNKSVVEESQQHTSKILGTLQTLMLFHLLSTVQSQQQQPREAEAVEASDSDKPPGFAAAVAKVSPMAKVIPKVTSCARIPSWLSHLGISGSIGRQTDETQTTYRVSLRLFAPAFCTTQAQAASFDLAWHTTSGSCDILPGTCIRLVNIISPAAKIFRACRAGDLVKMRKLFAARKASVYDVTSENHTLLYLAIESGNVETVRFLLDSAADVNWTFGKNQTSALQWALYKNHLEITRLLLAKGADGTHISADGWTPIHHLLHGGHSEGPSRTLEDFLTMLAGYSDKVPLDLETKNQEGYSALQMAATWHSGRVIEQLLGLGASMSEFDAEPWRHPNNPIWFAIAQGNVSAFKILLPFYENVNASDHLGLTMLNYTARYGREEMTDLLLRSGSFEIFPEYYGDSDESLGGQVETGNISDEDDWEDQGLKEWTRETYDKYMDALRRHGRVVVQRDEDEEGEVYDTFWDAVESPNHLT